MSDTSGERPETGRNTSIPESFRGIVEDISPERFKRLGKLGIILTTHAKDPSDGLYFIDYQFVPDSLAAEFEAELMAQATEGNLAQLNALFTAFLGQAVQMDDEAQFRVNWHEVLREEHYPLMFEERPLVELPRGFDDLEAAGIVPRFTYPMPAQVDDLQDPQ